MAELNASIGKTNDVFDKNNVELRSLGKILLLTRIAAVAIAVVLVFFILMHLHNLFSPSKLAPSIQKEFVSMAPELASRSKSLVAEVFPHYSEAIQKKAASLSPLFEKALDQEIALFGDQLTLLLEKNMLDAIKRVTETQLKRMSEKIPHLKTEEGQAWLYDRLHGLVVDEMNTLLFPRLEKFNLELKSLKQKIDNLKQSQFQGYSTEELQRYFAHLWLQLLDQVVLNPDQFFNA